MSKPALRMPRSLWITAAILVMLAIAFSVPWKLDFARDTIAQRVQAATGRSFAIEGDIHWRWWQRRFTAQRLRFANPAWAGREQMVTADLIDAQVQLLPLLLERRLVLPHVRVVKPDLWLETTADGQFNARFDSEQQDRDAGVTLQAVELDQGVVRFVEKHRQTDLQVRFDNDTGRGEAASRLAARASGRWRGLEASAQGTGETLLRLREASRPYAFDVAATIGGTRVKAAGIVTGLAKPTAADLKVEVEGPTLAEWYRIVGLGLPNTPPYRTQGHVRLDAGAWLYEDFTSRVGGSDVAGRMRLEPRPARPFITGELVSQRLDLHDILPVIGKTPPPARATAAPDARGRQPHQPVATAAPSRTLLPQWTFSAEKWDTLDADVRFDGRKVVNVGPVPFDRLKTRIVLDNRRLKLDPMQLSLAGGELTGTVLINGRTQPMDASLNVSGRGLKLEQLLPIVDNQGLALGTANAKLVLAGSGNSLGQMLGSADGEAQVAMGRGQISNLLLELIDLDGQEALGFLIRGDQPVAVRCGLIDVGWRKGVMSTRNMVFDTNDTIIEATGSADFGKEQLDLRVKPVAKDVSLVTLRVPFEVKGPFREPKVTPDRGRLALRAGAALLLGSVNPIAALIPLIETGPGKDADCASLLARARSEGVPVKNERAKP